MEFNQIGDSKITNSRGNNIVLSPFFRNIFKFSDLKFYLNYVNCNEFIIYFGFFKNHFPKIK